MNGDAKMSLQNKVHTSDQQLFVSQCILTVAAHSYHPMSFRSVHSFTTNSHYLITKHIFRFPASDIIIIIIHIERGEPASADYGFIFCRQFDEHISHEYICHSACVRIEYYR